MKTATP